ncbi:MAG TPA: TetR/AcrR family transcriptional regulator [Paraburkholderia sp.]|jgi:TetR/AcrR family transcriptional repressor of nem operon
MKKSKVETAETRRRIVDVAARQFRLNGIQATGLNDLMAEAGLTRGGFYRHFESKDQLVAEACARSFESMIASLENAASESDGEGTGSFQAIVDRYVSDDHRDNRAARCPLAAMGSELARADEGTRAAASEGMDDLVEVVTKCLGRSQPDVTQSRAVFAVAAMVGAITMSRIIVDPNASSRVLQFVKEHLDTL